MLPGWLGASAQPDCDRGPGRRGALGRAHRAGLLRGREAAPAGRGLAVGAGRSAEVPFSPQFVHINNLKLICRAHQLVHEGYKFMFDEKLVTVWSAPNYCYRCGNIASIMVFKDVNTREPKLFRAVPDSERVIPPRTTTPYFL